MTKARTTSVEIANFVRGRTVTLREFAAQFPSSAANGGLIAVLIELGFVVRERLTPEEERVESIRRLETRLAKLRGVE